jgi:thiamine-phosphate pyrophosphorylase
MVSPQAAVPIPRLYLMTPLVSDAAAFAASFEAALGACDIACVFLRASAGDAKAMVRQLAPIAQRRGIACLVSDPHLAIANDCDGVHVDGVGPQLEAALAAMKPQRIVGVGGIDTRHDAMSAGEAGADYVMFGAPDEQRDFAEIRERTAWWAEIFTLPCVAYAQTLDEIAELARAGADFVGICGAVWDDARGPVEALQAASRALAAADEQAT